MASFYRGMKMCAEDRCVAAVREAAVMVDVWQDGGVEVVVGDGRFVDMYVQGVRVLDEVRRGLVELREEEACWWRLVDVRLAVMDDGGWRS